jgi:hypothetical protein
MRYIRLSIPPVALLLLLAAAVTGCGGGSDKSADAPTVPHDHFVRDLSASEARKIGGTYGLSGQWTLVIGNGVYTLAGPAQPFGGSALIRGKAITFGPPSLPQAQQQKLSESQRKRLELTLQAGQAPCGPAVGEYRFTNTSKTTTTFKVLKDECKPRRVALSRPWTRR